MSSCMIIIILCILLIHSLTVEKYNQYRVYKQSKNSLIPNHMYRMWEYPYEWPYTANNFPLEQEQVPAKPVPTSKHNK